MRKVGPHRRVVRVRVQREAVHDRQCAPARAVSDAERLEERGRRGRGPDPVRTVATSRRERTAPDAEGRIDGLQRVVRLGKQLEVGRSGGVRPVGCELREPETIEVGLVADDDVVERRERARQCRGVLRELRLCGRVQRGRARAGVVDRDVDPHAREPRRGLDVLEHLQLVRRRRDEARLPVRRDPHRREAGEPQLRHVGLRADEVRRADIVLCGAERHRRAGCACGGEREREESGDRARGTW